ncbi:MAG TPA: hypothetical protein VNT75_19140, partial [Symbiobacteriaceae bacterium]|nr:hypothetical protein [Symbiobacteriaceae bacterium]
MRDLVSPGLPPALAAAFAQLEAAYARMAHLTRDMSQDEVDYTGPEGAPNSTAMLIAHIARTDL